MRRKSAVLIISGFASFCFTTYSVNSAPPVDFDNWQLDNGDVSAVCPEGFTCVEDQLSGIYQRTLTDDSLGDQFIQQIVVSDDGDFKSENFTRSTQQPDNQDDGLGGISVKQSIDEPDLLSTAIVNTGWANTESVAVQIEQEVTSQDYPNIGFISQFSYAASRDADDNNTGEVIAMRQEIHVGSQASGFRFSSNLDDQVFALRVASGSFVNSSGEVSLPCTGIFGNNSWGGGGSGWGGSTTGDSCTEGRGGADSGFGRGGGWGSFGGFGFGITPPGGTVTWDAGDELVAIWIGQSGGGSFGGGSSWGGSGGRGGSFSYQSYENLSNSEGPIGARSVFGIQAPIDWPTDPFGPMPTFSSSGSDGGTGGGDTGGGDTGGGWGGDGDGGRGGGGGW